MIRKLIFAGFLAASMPAGAANYSFNYLVTSGSSPLAVGSAGVGRLTFDPALTASATSYTPPQPSTGRYEATALYSNHVSTLSLMYGGSIYSLFSSADISVIDQPANAIVSDAILFRGVNTSATFRIYPSQNTLWDTDLSVANLDASAARADTYIDIQSGSFGASISGFHREDDIAAVPEPSELAMLASGLVFLSGIAWRRTRRTN